MKQKTNKSIAKKTVKKAPSKAIALPAIDKKWQAEDDARMLMRAEEIKVDKKRLNAAKTEVAAQVQAATKIGKL